MEDDGFVTIYQSGDQMFQNNPHHFAPVAGLEPVKKDEALKFDSNKVGVHLLPSGPLMQIAEVLDFGVKKYAAHNWRKGFDWSRLSGAAMRHLLAWNEGEDIDPESGLPHLAHLGCCVLFLLEHQSRGLGTDDRYKV
jgi:hypothetical protein